MSVTLLDARRQLLKDVPELGKTHTLTAVATGSITIGSLANTNLPANKFSNMIAYRGEAASAADYRRYLGALTASTGLIAHTGANYSDTTVTNEEVEIWYDPEIVPDLDVNGMYADALTQLRTLCRVPLAHGPIDYDMQASGITNWTANSGTPFAKQTTAAEVIRGRSGVLTDAGSGGDYTQSALNPLSRGGRGYMYFIAKADTGTGKFVVLDQDSNEQASISTTQEDWVLGWKEVQFDSTDEQWRLRVQAVAVADSVDVDSFWFVKADNYYFDLTRFPGWVTDKHNVVGLSVGHPQAQGDEADTYTFRSMQYERLREGIDFYFERLHGNINPTGVFVLQTHLMGRPLFLEVSSPWSEPYGVARAFSAETDTTDCNLRLLNAQVKILMGERYKKLAWLRDEGAREKLTVLSQMSMPAQEPRRSGWAAGAFR